MNDNGCCGCVVFIVGVWISVSILRALGLL